MISLFFQRKYNRLNNIKNPDFNKSGLFKIITVHSYRLTTTKRAAAIISSHASIRIHKEKSGGKLNPLLVNLIPPQINFVKKILTSQNIRMTYPAFAIISLVNAKKPISKIAPQMISKTPNTTSSQIRLCPLCSENEPSSV